MLGGVTISSIHKFVSDYAQSGVSRFHMPGHKGNCPGLNALGGLHDITEVEGADVLFSADGIIAQTEQALTRLYGCTTVLSAGGSTLCIQAMLTLAARRGGRLLAGRNAHLALINACALLGIDPLWIYPDYNPQTGLPDQLNFQQIQEELLKHPDVRTVYLTSPDYLGQMADIQQIADLCHSRDAWLIVDNAHGAHLKFTPKDLHPIALGADLCCNSAHKTLPALTGGAFLHAKRQSSQELKSAMALFGSTSPSYLILESLDLCADYLEEQAKQDFLALWEQWEELARAAEDAGLGVLRGGDQTKLSLDAFAAGIEGPQLASLLREHKIEPEYVSCRTVVLMLSPFNTALDHNRLLCALDAVCSRTTQLRNKGEFVPIEEQPATFCYPKQRLTPRQALLSPCVTLPLAEAAGRICAENKIVCPPGVPILVAGELVTDSALQLLKNSGIRTLNVVE